MMESMRLLPTLARIVPKGTKLLSKEQEQALFKLLREARRRKKSTLVTPIYQLIVEMNIGLIHMYLKQRGNPYPDLHDDFVQEGVFGLYTAIERFEPERNLRFSTYAWQWIRAKVGRAIDEEGLDRSAPIPGASSEFTYGRRGTKRNSMVSLDQTITQDGHDMTLGEIIPGDENVEQDVLREEAQWYVNRSAKRVTERSKDKRVSSLFRNRILSEEPETLKQLGTREHLSRERIRQIEAKIIDQLTEDLEKLGYVK